MVGWLELPLDDAPRLVVAGLDEGSASAALAGGLLSPPLRRSLGLQDSETLNARDLYYLELLLASRDTTLVTGRRGAQGEPLSPRRILLAGATPELVETVLTFWGEPEAGGGSEDNAPDAAESAFGPILPSPDVPIPNRLPATAFRDYLACPYRFYLRHVLGLRQVRDLPRELPPGDFGRLLHAVLGRFARSPAATSDDSEVIARTLVELLEEESALRSGGMPRVAVRLQLEQLRRRLRSFAAWQAAQRRAGWTIDQELVEVRVDATLDVDGSPFVVTGRIDRVDRHPTSGSRLLDYKSAEQSVDPEQAHRSGRRGERRWTDLQLPLYELMLRQRGVGGGPPGGALELASSTSDTASARIRWPALTGARAISPKRERWPETSCARFARAGSGRPASRRRSRMGSRDWSATRSPTAPATWAPADDGHHDHRGRGAPTKQEASAAASGPAIAQPHRVVRASAGSGKTHRLALRYLEILFSGGKPDSIVAATFTREAAGEILGRVLTRLAAAAGDAARRAGWAASSAGRTSSAATPSARCALSAPCSIASWSRRSTASSSGSPRRCGSSSGSPACPPSQRSTIRCSGRCAKRRSRRRWPRSPTATGASWSISSSVSVARARDGRWRALSISYCSSSTRSTSKRRSGSCGADCRSRSGPKPASSRSRSRCSSRRFALRRPVRCARRSRGTSSRRGTARGTGCSIEVWSASSRAIRRRRASAAPPSLPPGVTSLLVLVEHARRQVLATEVARTQATHHLLDAFHQQYWRLRRRRGVLLFSDLAAGIERWLEAAPDGALDELYYRIDERVGHLLLDEFQDTSLAQWSVLRPIAEEIRAWGDGSRTFFCVGDPKQAIYGWRGGCADLFDQIEEDLALDPASGERLEESFRSSQIVLDAVNLVFGQIGDGPGAGGARGDGGAMERRVRRASIADGVTGLRRAGGVAARSGSRRVGGRASS